MHRALVVDDRAAGREIIGRELVKAKFSVLFASDIRETLMLLDSERLNLIVTDHREHGVDGIELVRSVRGLSDVPVVVLAASGSIPDCECAMREGANRYLLFHDGIDNLGDVAGDVVFDDSQRRSVSEALTTEEARALNESELRCVLQRLVVECRGNIAEIARRMNRDRSTVRYHLRRMGMLDGRSVQVSGRGSSDADSAAMHRNAR